jgi:starch phosphorylase
VRRVAESFRSNLFCPDQPDFFSWIYRMILDENDEFLHLADLSAYLDAQEKAAKAFKDPAGWARMVILNIARVGKFSSDRTIREYARDIWHVDAV